MTAVDFTLLLRAILSPKAKLDVPAIERMGLLAVKIAQMYSMRPDLVAPEKCLRLATLLQRTAPLSAEQFQARWNELIPPAFATLGPRASAQPIASASLGQVHLAELPDGRKVVVKLSRAEVEESFVADVARMRRWLKSAVMLYPALERLADPVRALEDVERQTLCEMNFLAEPVGAGRLAALAEEGAPGLPHLRNLRFPRYHIGCSSNRFLVSDFVEGPTLASLLDRGALGYDMLLELFRIHGYFLFVRGKFHGDLHPGNVIYREGFFCFVDNANIELIPAEFSRGLFQMLVQIGEGDLERAAETLASLSLSPLTRPAFDSFASRFRALYSGASEASLTRQMMETVKLAVSSGITFPSGAFPLVKSLMYLDGMVLRAAPRANLLQDVRRFADDFLTQSASSSR